VNKLLVIPFLTSLGALIYEFSIAQFLGMALGNATFAFSYAVGIFLLAMGYGSFRASQFSDSLDVLDRLLKIETLLALLCFVTLPLLVEASSFFRYYTLGFSSCQSLICSNAGIGLLVISSLLLFLVGAAVGMEMPLFFRILKLDQAKILAADYFGAFAAGVIFPLFLLPTFGLWGALSLAALFHLLVGIWGALKMRQRSKKYRSLVWGLQSAVAIAIVCQLVFSVDAERFLMQRLTTYLVPIKTAVLESFRTRKQQVLLTQAEMNGGSDLRLYLDGYLQFSSEWNTESYHNSMALVARKQLNTEVNSANVLILGGGDGLLAETILTRYPQDQIKVVDFDCELLEAFKTRPHLRALSPQVWDSPRVSFSCDDAFHFVQRPEESQKWDLVLVDFPHGVGDAASLRVETWEFFSDLRTILTPSNGRVVIHHEKYDSEERVCVERTLAAAGFTTTSFPAEDSMEPEAMIIGKYQGMDLAQPDFSRIQTIFRPRCVSAFKRFGRICLGG
jgi:spermidine synthase